MKRLPTYVVLLMITTLMSLTACSKSDGKQYLGYIEARYVYVSPNVPGNLLLRPFKRGNQIKAGDLIFTLDPEPELSQLKAAQFQEAAAKKTLADLIKGQRQTVLLSLEAQLQEAQAREQLAETDYKRYQHLYKTRVVGKAQLDDSETNYKAAVQTVNQLKANLEEGKLGAREDLINAQEEQVRADEQNTKAAQWKFDQKTVKAPIGGIIYDTFFRVGEYVPVGQPILAIINPKEVHAEFYVPERDLSSIKLEQTVYFTCDGCQKSQAAKISFISQEAEYTPPVIFSNESREKLVYRVEADLPENIAFDYHPGQPIQVTVK